MKKLLAILFISFVSSSIFAQNIFINEINYKVSDPMERGIEIVGPKKAKINNYQVHLYDENGVLYHTETLSGTIPSGSGTHNAIWFPIAELHNSDNQSLQFDDNNGNTLQQISIGSNTASPKSFVNIGIVQADSTKSLQLIGTGLTLLDFAWTNLQSVSKGAVNTNELFIVPVIIKTAPITNAVSVSWSASRSIQSGYFEVQRSEDGVNYEVIGIVSGAATYAYEDKGGEEGVHFYRVKWIDEDSDDYITSNSSEITLHRLAEIQLYPNPVNRYASLNIKTDKEEMTHIIFYDLMGKIVKDEMLKGHQSVSVRELNRGTYFYKVMASNKTLKEGKLVIIE